MIICADGFDTYGTSAANMLLGPWTGMSDASPQTTQFRTGTHSLRVNPANSANAMHPVPANSTDLFLHFALYPDGLASGNQTRVQFHDSAGSAQAAVAWSNDGSITVRRGDYTGTILGTSATGVILSGQWQHVQIAMEIGDSASVEVRVNGVTVLSLSGVDTQNTANAGANTVRFNHRTGAGGTYYLDDYVCCDDQGSEMNALQGDMQVEEDMPDADAEADWTPSSGSTMYEMVDERPQDGDTTYIESGTVNDRARVSFPDLPADAAIIKAVGICAVMRKTDSGDGTVALGVRSGSSEDDDGGTALSTSYSAYQAYFTLDPDTSSAWSRTAAQAAEAVLERTL